MKIFLLMILTKCVPTNDKTSGHLDMLINHSTINDKML